MKWKAQRIWDDCECWIIGGGWSISEQFNVPEKLRPLTMEEFRKYGEYLKPIHNKRIIGVNVAAFLGSWVDVAYWGDNSTYLDFRKGFDDFSGLKVSSGGKFADKKFKSILYLKSNSRETFCLSKEHLCWRSRNSGAAAINLAYHLGAKRVILLGYDMKMNPSEKYVHWHGGYPDKKQTPKIAEKRRNKNIIHPRKKPGAPFHRHKIGFPDLAKKAKKYGLEVINASPDSELDCFPKMTVEEVLNGNK